MNLPQIIFHDYTIFSRAIMKYLMDKYAKDNSLYPKDLKSRAVIDARLDFDCGSWWPKFYTPIVIIVFISLLIEEGFKHFKIIFFLFYPEKFLVVQQEINTRNHQKHARACRSCRGIFN